MKKLLTILFAISIAGFSNAQNIPEQLSLKEATTIFLECNLQLIAEQYNISKAQAQVSQAKLFENPVISLEQNVYNRLNGKYFDIGKKGEAAVEIEQVINLAGQRNKRIRFEKINKEIAEYQFEETLRTLRGELNKTFVEAYFLSRSIEIYDKEINTLEQLLYIIKEQQSKGNISMMECSRLEVLLLSLKREKAELQNNITINQGELKLLLNLPAKQEISLVFNDSILHRLSISTTPLDYLLQKLDNRPDVKIALAETNAAKANLKLQRSMAAPTFSVKGMYDRAGNFIENYFAIGINISIPIFNRNQGNIRSAKCEIQQNNQEVAYIREKAHMELHTAFNQLKKNIELYQASNNGLENNFEQLITGVNENYQKRNISMLEFIDYYQSYKETFLQLHEVKKNVFLAMENLNIIIGQTIFNY